MKVALAGPEGLAVGPYVVITPARGSGTATAVLAEVSQPHSPCS